MAEFTYQNFRRWEYERRTLFERPQFTPRGLSQPKPNDDDDGGTGDIDLRPQGHPLLNSVQFQGVDTNMSANTENSEHVEHNISPDHAPASTPQKAAALKSALQATAAPKNTL